MIARQFWRFCVVGTVGFIVDAGTLFAILRSEMMGPYWGRCVSFLAAVSVTWLLNRKFTFASRALPGPEFVRFVTANAVGVAINFATYTLVIVLFGASGFFPVIGVALGSLAGLAVNFTLSRTLVFSPDARDRGS